MSGTSQGLSVSSSRTTRNCSRRENSRDRRERSSRQVSLPTHLMANRPWGRPCLLARPVANMEGLAAKIWSNSGITTLTSSAPLMTLMYQRITISRLLSLLRPSPRVAALQQQHLQKTSINPNLRKREQRKILHPTPPPIPLPQMTTAIRRKRRKLPQLPRQA